MAETASQRAFRLLWTVLLVASRGAVVALDRSAAAGRGSDPDPSNAIARYGRGLSLQRLGHQQEADQEIARAIANSEGQASQFFEISG